MSLLMLFCEMMREPRVMPKMLVLSLMAAFASLEAMAAASGSYERGEINVYSVDDRPGDQPASFDNRLICYYCYQSVHGPSCVTLANMSKVERQTCLDEEVYCSVEWQITEGQMVTFSRGCAEKCTPTCISTGDLYPMEKCTQCCGSVDDVPKNHLCNTYKYTRSTGISHTPSLLALTSTLFILLLYRNNFLE